MRLSPLLSALSPSLQHSLLSETSQSPCFLRTLHMQVLWLECAPQLCLALCIRSQSHRGGGLSFPHPQAEFNNLTSATSVLLESQDSCNKTGGKAYLYTLSHLKTTPNVSRRSLSKSQCYLPGLSLRAPPAPGPHLQGPSHNFHKATSEKTKLEQSTFLCSVMNLGGRVSPDPAWLWIHSWVVAFNWVAIILKFESKEQQPPLWTTNSMQLPTEACGFFSNPTSSIPRAASSLPINYFYRNVITLLKINISPVGYAFILIL